MLSGNSSFAPVLHNITPERVVFVYNSQKDGSYEVASYYQSKRGLPSENLISISITPPVSTSSSIEECEGSITLFEYLNDIETPIINGIRSISHDGDSGGGSLSGFDAIWAIVLGYGIPLSFENGNGEIIAVASHLHRLGKSEFSEPKSANHTFDRRASFTFFDGQDATKLFITAVLDGPTVQSVKTLIDRSIDVDNQTFVAGKIFVDPYGLKETTEQLRYQSALEEFVQYEIPYLGLESNVTMSMEDPYLEPTVKSLERDSFYWGWHNPTYSKDLFLNQNERRVFLYNADETSACNLHFYDTDNESVFDENGSDKWCNLAINVLSGYAACAGAVDECGEDSYLMPRPFFEALHHGACLGEAFLFAAKYVDWKIILIGDPLMVVNFPVDLPSHQDPDFSLLPNNEVILRIKKSMEESLGWAMRQVELFGSLVDYVVNGKILDETIALLSPLTNWRSLKNDSAQSSLYYNIVSNWLQYVQRTTSLSLSQWLEEHGHKISSRLNDVIVETGSSEVGGGLVYDVGYWDLTFQYIHQELTLEDIHFNLDVATDEDFNDVIYSFSTLTSVNNWLYEREPFAFFVMPETGFPSNFSKRRIKFVSSPTNYLSQGEIYFVRWIAVDSEGNSIGEYTSKRIIGWS